VRVPRLLNAFVDVPNGRRRLIHVAAAHGDLALVEALVSLGASVLLVDGRGRLPCDVARASGHALVSLRLDELGRRESRRRFRAVHWTVDSLEMVCRRMARNRGMEDRRRVYGWSYPFRMILSFVFDVPTVKSQEASVWQGGAADRELPLSMRIMGIYADEHPDS